MIPQANALATDRNREQTRRICELKGCGVEHAPDGCVWAVDKSDNDWRVAELIEGSLTLDQVVRMLEAEGMVREDVKWRHKDCYGWAYKSCTCGGRLHFSGGVYDLTAAMDTLIKVLETKGEKE